MKCSEQTNKNQIHIEEKEAKKKEIMCARGNLKNQGYSIIMHNDLQVAHHHNGIYFKYTMCTRTLTYAQG